MKTKLLLASLLLGAAFVAACKPSADQATAKQLDKAQAVAQDAAQEMQDYAFEKKTEFVASMKVKLAELNRSVDELAAKIEKSTDAVKAEARPKLAALREQAAQLSRQVDAAQNANASTWDGIKADANKTYAALKDGFAKARQWLSEKIAP